MARKSIEQRIAELDERKKRSRRGSANRSERRPAQSTSRRAI